MKKPFALFGLMTAFLFLSSCASSEASLLPKERLLLGGPAGESIELLVEVADTAAERGRGLMGRRALAKGTGMLFVFPQEQTVTFWMKNTRIPLDVLFFDDDGAFLGFASMTPCREDPCMRYPSPMDTRYALEVPWGFVLREDIDEEWRLQMP